MRNSSIFASPYVLPMNTNWCVSKLNASESAAAAAPGTAHNEAELRADWPSNAAGPVNKQTHARTVRASIRSAASAQLNLTRGDFGRRLVAEAHEGYHAIASSRQRVA